MLFRLDTTFIKLLILYTPLHSQNGCPNYSSSTIQPVQNMAIPKHAKPNCARILDLCLNKVYYNTRPTRWDQSMSG